MPAIYFLAAMTGIELPYPHFPALILFNINHAVLQGDDYFPLYSLFSRSRKVTSLSAFCRYFREKYLDEQTFSSTSLQLQLAMPTFTELNNLRFPRIIRKKEVPL